MIPTEEDDFMATGRRPPRRRANPKFYIFIGIIAAAAVAAIFFLTNIQTAVVEDGTIPFETTVPVVVVRDEQIITLSLIHIWSGTR